MLITFEGIDGAGKSTQARLFYNYLISHGTDAVLTYEPTDGPYGRVIRMLAQENHEPINVDDEYILFMEDRREHVENIIYPALEAGKTIISDRYYHSTIAYQGARGMNQLKIQKENELYFPVPDIIFLFNINPEIGLVRIDNRDTYEYKSYQEDVAEIFDSMSGVNIYRLSGMMPIAETHELIKVIFKGI